MLLAEQNEEDDSKGGVFMGIVDAVNVGDGMQQLLLQSRISEEEEIDITVARLLVVSIGG